jgi:hypothetical protein
MILMPIWSPGLAFERKDQAVNKSKAKSAIGTNNTPPTIRPLSGGVREIGKTFGSSGIGGHSWSGLVHLT